MLIVQTEDPTYTWPVFAEKWQAENFYGKQYGWDVAPVVHKVTVDPKNIAYEDGSKKGGALDHTKAEKLEFWVPGPEGGFNEGSAPDFTSYPGMVNVADTLFYDSSDNEYKQGGDLSSLRESGQHTEFDLGRIETWPGFDDLPEATDPANPEVGTQEYYEQTFELGNSDTYPSVGEMPFVDVINNNIVSMADLQNVVDGTYNPEDNINDNSNIIGLPLDQSLYVQKISDNTGSSDLIWSDGSLEFLVTTKNVAPYVEGHANGFAATYDSSGNVVVAFAIQDAGQWNAEIKTFDPQTGIEVVFKYCWWWSPSTGIRRRPDHAKYCRSRQWWVGSKFSKI